MEDQHANSKSRWKNRRRMAYISLVSILIVVGLSLFVVPIERLQVLEEVITWFFFIMGSIIGAYVGFSTFDDKWNKEKRRIK